MKARTNPKWFILFFTVFVFSSTPSFALDPSLEQIGDFGFIDWVNQTVTAKGAGAPPEKYFGTPQARPMAIRAAVADARRNLLEVIKGVHIDSTTTVENELAKDDTIILKVKGVLKFSSPGEPTYFSDGTVETTVSMPLTGELSRILLSQGAGAPAAPGVEDRLRQLENRIRALENQVAAFKKISLEQKEALIFFRQLVQAWLDVASQRPLLLQAGFEQSADMSALQKQLKNQESRLAGLSVRMDKMIGRLAALEDAAGKAPEAPSTTAKTEVPYSGLVVDARDIGFRPSLKPILFAQGQQIFPGDYVDMRTAIRNGYVRYYRKLSQAQQSRRAGKLPYTIKAQGIGQGNRSLAIGPEEARMVNAIIKAPNNFLRACNIVIVF